MKLTIGKQFDKKWVLSALLLSASLFSTSQVSANDPDLTIQPVVNQFPQVVLGTDSPATTFKIKNTHASNNLTLGTVTLQGTHASEFAVGTQNCTSQTLAPQQECTIDVKYHPTSFGSKMAMLQVVTDAPNTPTIVAFLSNDEGNVNQAERRLPPVLFSLNMTETMISTNPYMIEWSMLGYHDSYQSVVALFDCTNKLAGDCGVDFSDNFFNSGLITSTSTTPQPTWTFNGEAAVEHHFEQAFTPDVNGFPQTLSGTYQIVARFYRKNNMDVMSGEPSLSLMIPGNLSSQYYDKEGRRIIKNIQINP